MDANCLISRMLFSELHKIMVNEVTFLGFKGGGAIEPIVPLDPPLVKSKFPVMLSQLMQIANIY